MDRDATLVERLRERGAGAAEELVDTYGDRVYRLAVRITGSPSDAEEVAHRAQTRIQRDHAVGIGEQRIHVELDDLGQVGVPGSGTTLTLYLPSPWPDAEPTIARAAESIIAADLGDEAAQERVDDAEGHELSWYATQELGPWLDLL